MEWKQLEVFSEESNFAIVRMPGRNFPGCVIQGDSLSNLLKHVQELRLRAKASGDAELIDLADDVSRAIATRLDHYEAVLHEHGIPLPYVRKVAESGSSESTAQN